MKTLTIVILALALAGAAAAQSLGPVAPAKAPGSPVSDLPPPARQGGDTIANAFVIPSLPFDDTGTTVGYADDYAEMCPYGNWAPDVVYRYVPTVSESIDIDLCGSHYDTLILVYDAGLHLVACNDDYYFDDPPCLDYVSFISSLPVVAGQTYYIMIDGYTNASGEYQLHVVSNPDCVVSCLPGAAPEGEPPLQNGQANGFNSGCADESGAFQTLSGGGGGTIDVCGVSGWFTFESSDYRDTDWFSVTVGPGGVVHAELIGEQPTSLFHLAPTDCGAVVVAQSVTSDCLIASMDVAGVPGEVIWLWVGPPSYWSPTGQTPYEYDYDLNLTGLEPVVATESASWGAIKSLYR